MNGHEVSPPAPMIRLRRRHPHSDGRPPDRYQSQHRHRTRPAGSARPRSRDRDQPGTGHQRRTPTRPEEGPSSRRAGGGYAAADRCGSTPGGRSKKPGWCQCWGGTSHASSSRAAPGVSARQPRRSSLSAVAAALKALFGFKRGVKHGERKAVAAGGRQKAAVVSPASTAAAAADLSWSGGISWATDSSRGSSRSKGTVPPRLKAVSDDTSVRSDYTKGSSTRRPPYRPEATLTMEDILRATDNFSSACRIGQGGFGSVYKGVLPDGKVVAVKRAKKDSGDQFVDLEFQCEISILPHVTHLNLVRFICYVEGRGERVMVVEYVPNGTLREHLDGTPNSLGSELKILRCVCYAC